MDKPFIVRDCTLKYDPNRRVLYVHNDKTGVCVLRITGLNVPSENMDGDPSNCALAEIQLHGHLTVTSALPITESDLTVNGRALVR